MVNSKVIAADFKINLVAWVLIDAALRYSEAVNFVRLAPKWHLDCSMKSSVLLPHAIGTTGRLDAHPEKF